MKHYSTQPRKQRLFGYNRNAHDRSRAMSAHLSDELLKEYSRIRSLTVRKGDTVKVVRGAFKGQVAKVIRLFPRKGMKRIFASEAGVSGVRPRAGDGGFRT